MIEMEQCLTLDELNILVESAREAQYENQKFLAALKGIDLDGERAKEDPEDAFRRVEMRAQAALAGMSEEHYVFDIIGIEVESDDED